MELRDTSGDRPAEADGREPALPPSGGESVSPPNTASAEGSGAPTLLPGGSGFEGNGFETPPVLAEPGCKKVDFLFVIDNSLSMAFAQGNLRSSFDGFMRVIDEHVDAEDFHIMVVDTDAWEDDDDGEDDGGDRCRNVLGAGRRINGDTGADCGLPGNERFITRAQPDLVETFSCMATVGTFGDNNEQPVDALLSAISDSENGTQGCNAGFLRRDAVLVVTLITNADDEGSRDEPADWLESLLGLKGEDNALVVLGLIGDSSLTPAGSGLGCLFSSLGESPRLRELVEGLEHGELASVCSPDYSPFFEQAVQSIDTACTDFIPPVIQ